MGSLVDNCNPQSLVFLNMQSLVFLCNTAVDNGVLRVVGATEPVIGVRESMVGWLGGQGDRRSSSFDEYRSAGGGDCGCRGPVCSVVACDVSWVGGVGAFIIPGALG